MKCSHTDLNLMYLLESVLRTRVNGINWQFLIGNDIKVILVGHFYFLYSHVQVIISDFLGIEVEKADLTFDNVLLLSSKNWVVLSCFFNFWYHHRDYPVKWIKFYHIESIGSYNLSLLDLFFFVFHERTPPEDMLLHLLSLTAWHLFQKDKSDSAIVAYNRRLNVNFVLKFKNCLLGYLTVFLEVINLHFVVFLNTELVFLWFTGCGLQ